MRRGTRRGRRGEGGEGVRRGRGGEGVRGEGSICETLNMTGPLERESEEGERGAERERG